MPDHEELDKRRQQRAARRKQQQEEQRKLKRKLVIAAAVLLICGVAILLLSLGGKEEAPNAAMESVPTETNTIPTTEAPDTAPTEKSKRDPVTVINIRACGDLNITDEVILAGAGANGYDFTRCFQDVAGVLSGADLTLLNFEGILSGGPYGGASTSAPLQMAQALKAAGVDIVQTANSNSVQDGLIGLRSTLDSFRNAGIEPVGTFASPEEFKKSKGFTICEIQGVKVAVVAFTKGVGSMGLPAGSEDCVNLLYNDYATTYQDIDEKGIKKLLKTVSKEKPDITIALLHWGSEYNDTVSASQKKIASLMKEQGVDIIIGTHSHRVQQIDYSASGNTLVAYSLGDFFGSATEAGSNYSIVLDIEITKDADAGTTQITGYSVIPIYTLKESETCDGQRRVVVIEDAMKAYEEDFIDKVTPEAYASMEASLERIADRIKPKNDQK